MTTLEIVEILVRIAWLVGAVAFVIGLSRMNSPATARNGNLVSAGGHGPGHRRDRGPDPHASAHRATGISAPVWIIIIAASCSAAGLGCTRRGP